MIRRESRPFTVEVKKGQKRALQGSSGEQPLPLHPKASGESLEDIFRRAEAALFDRSHQPSPDTTEEVPASAPEGARADYNEPVAAAAGSNKGRILETLNEVDPLESMLAERAQVTRRGRKPGSKNKPKPMTPASSEPRASRSATFGMNGHEASRLIAANDTAQGAPSFGAHETAPRGKELLVDPQMGASVSSMKAGIMRPRGRIRGRYVTGSEPKPGERWKRRLRGGN